MLSSRPHNLEHPSHSATFLLRTLRMLPLGTLLVSAGLSATGCVYTHARVTPLSGSTRVATSVDPKSANILITDSSETGRHYIELGSIEASALSVNLMSSLPTRADVDEELRREAGKLGADAVIGVTYSYEWQGLRRAGRLRAKASAIRYAGVDARSKT